MPIYYKSRYARGRFSGPDLEGGPVPVPSLPVRGRDDLIILDAAALIRAMLDDDGYSVFNEVEAQTGPTDIPSPADNTATAHLWWEDFTEDSDATSGEEVDLVNRGQAIIQVRYRDQNPTNRLRNMSRIIEGIKNAVGGKSLAGKTEPFLTRVVSGRREQGVGEPDAGFLLLLRWQYVTHGEQAHYTLDEIQFPA
jgi:hypothetical protein